jgi:hypothetical protein
VVGGFGRRAKYRIPRLAGLRSVPEIGTQDEEQAEGQCPEIRDTVVSQKSEGCVPKNGELCPEKRDAYPSTLQYPPGTSPVQINVLNQRSGSRQPTESQKRHQKEEQEDQSQIPYSVNGDGWPDDPWRPAIASGGRA